MLIRCLVAVLALWLLVAQPAWSAPTPGADTATASTTSAPVDGVVIVNDAQTWEVVVSTLVPATSVSGGQAAATGVQPQAGAGTGGAGLATGGVGVTMPTEEEWMLTTARLPECSTSSAPGWCGCGWLTTPADSAGGSLVDPGAAAEAVARQAALSLSLPEPEIRLGPDPGVNKWDMAVVGLPIWVWTDSAGTVSSTVTTNGITIDLRAVRDRVVFDFGDGSTLACTTMSALPSSYRAGDESPTCGHVYESPSLPDGDYTITATAHWTFTWSTLGYTSSLPGQVSATRDVPVGELQAVLIPVDSP